MVFTILSFSLGNASAQCNPSTEAEFITCLSTSPTNIILTGSFSITSTITLTNNTDYSINLNGHNVTWNPATVTAFNAPTGNITITLISGANTETFNSNGNIPTIPVNLQNSGSFSSVLPIQLLSFDASKGNHHVALKWQTASETNNEKFIIERGDGQSFSRIGEVKGAGTTLQQTNYEFTDRAPAHGKNYYRLRQVDFDGKSEVSPVRMVLVGNPDTSIRVFPTVSSSEFTIQSSKGDISQIDVFDIKGRLVKTLNSEEDQLVSINMNDQLAGQYILVVSSNGNLSHHRVIKN